MKAIRLTNSDFAPGWTSQGVFVAGARQAIDVFAGSTARLCTILFCLNDMERKLIGNCLYCGSISRHAWRGCDSLPDSFPESFREVFFGSGKQLQDKV